MIAKSLVGERRTAWRLAAICAVLVLVWLLQAIPSETADEEVKCLPTRDPGLLRLRENELRATGENLLRVLRQRDSAAFLRLTNKRHFGMGEGENYSASQLSEEFTAKKDIYCYLFDARCIPTDSSAANLKYFSLSDLAQRRGSIIKQVEVWHQDGIEKPGCSGTVSFRWGVLPGEKLLPVEASSFTFTFEEGQWTTIGFDEVPVVRKTR